MRDFVTEVMLEAKEIGARIDIAIQRQPENQHAITAELDAFKSSSMLQAVDAGKAKAVELDTLVSVVRELGQLTQVPAPFTDVLPGVARVHGLHVRRHCREKYSRALLARRTGTLVVAYSILPGVLSELLASAL